MPTARSTINYIRPHEALKMDVPALHWKPSSRSFVAEPKTWDYPDPDHVRLVRENGSIGLRGEIYFVGRSLIGEKVQLQFVEDRVLVWFCRTLVREFNLQTKTSLPVDFGQLDHARTHGL